jgi:hypothetical protein
MRKTFVVIDIIFDESFHHISQERFIQHDGIQMFQDRPSILKVTTLRMSSSTIRTSIVSDRHCRLLFALTPSSLSISCVVLIKLWHCPALQTHPCLCSLDLYKKYNAGVYFLYWSSEHRHGCVCKAGQCRKATGKPHSDIEKMVIFLNHFHADRRPGVAVRIATVVLMKVTYEVTYKSVCEMCPIEETPHHRAMLVTKSTELCRRHGLGTCPHYADCRHIHNSKAGAFALKLTGKPPVLRPLLSHNRLDLSHIPITLQSAIVLRSDPALVLSRLPTLLVSLAVKSRRSSPCREPSEWILTHGPQVPLLTRAAHHLRVLMLRSSSSSSTAVYDATLPDSSDSDDVDCTPVKFTPPRTKSCAFILTPSIDVARLMKTYLESIRPTDNGDRRDWVSHVTTQEKSPPTPILAIFGWLTRCQSRQLSCARTDIANRSPALLHVVYLLAGAQYNGQYTMPPYRGYWNDDDFMTFSPLGPPYIQPGTPGSYVSTTEDLNAFSSHVVDLDTLESNFMTTIMHHLLYLALLFDFMALTAQTFR